MAEPDEQPLQVVLAGVLKLAFLDMHVVERQLFPGHQIVQVEAQGGEVFGQLVGLLLEGHEDAGLAELGSPAHQELHGKQRLPAAGAAADQGRPPLGEPAPGYLVQSLDPGGRFR